LRSLLACGAELPVPMTPNTKTVPLKKPTPGSSRDIFSTIEVGEKGPIWCNFIRACFHLVEDRKEMRGIQIHSIQIHSIQIHSIQIHSIQIPRVSSFEESTWFKAMEIMCEFGARLDVWSCEAQREDEPESLQALLEILFEEENALCLMIILEQNNARKTMEDEGRLVPEGVIVDTTPHPDGILTWILKLLWG
jgi:hypothetical protein